MACTLAAALCRWCVWRPLPGCRFRSRGEAGLFHTAILFETQADLAATVALAAQFDPSAYVGSADHLVSEAFYFTDPEGNGIELYWDRPREAWDWDDTPQGRTVRMASLALPPQQYFRTHLSEDALARTPEAAAGVGHVHLQVGDTDTAAAFYVDTLGFERTADFHGQALFVSAGGYHHHMAMNVWNSRGAGPRRDTLGLGEVLISVPGQDDVGSLADRLKSAGIASHPPVPNCVSKIPGATAFASPLPRCTQSAGWLHRLMGALPPRLPCGRWWL